jgi:hypothetical protein
MEAAVAAIAEELAKHRLDTFNQDSGQHCVCRSDSRFQQLRGALDDPPWQTIDEHRAWMVLEALRLHMDIATPPKEET